MIFIPGLGGTELKSKKTGERIWFNPIKARSEDIKLPLEADPTLMHDDLEPGDVLRGLKVVGVQLSDIYGDFLRAMETRAGYHIESWDQPGPNGDHDAIYLFPYDWRMDNVRTAQALMRKVEELRAKLHRPDLKFDVVAHSMGGLVARYAAMYGNAELAVGNAAPTPTWPGAKTFDKVILLGTPNEGSTLTLDVLLNGFTIGGYKIDVPFLIDTSKYTAFTIPSTYQLLPAPGTVRAYDDRLEPVDIDIYDPKTWSRHGWNVLDDKEYVSHFDSRERQIAADYFAAALARAKRFHEALAVRASEPRSLRFYSVGADCRSALDGMVVYRDRMDGDKWKTLFRAKGFTRWDGYRINDADLKKLLYAPGDGIVTKRSMNGATTAKSGGKAILNFEDTNTVCEEHNRLAANRSVQEYVIKTLAPRLLTASGGSQPEQRRSVH